MKPSKSSSLEFGDDIYSDGRVNPGEILTYTLKVFNQGALPYLGGNLKICDTLPETLEYVPNSTTYEVQNSDETPTINATAISDIDSQSSAPPFPLNGCWTLPDLIPKRGRVIVMFLAKVKESVLDGKQDECIKIENQANISDANSSEFSFEDVTDACFFCRNDQPSTSDVDAGCSLDTPNCFADLGENGIECRLSCTNNQTIGIRDDGCPTERPNCDAGSGQVGTECYLCINDKVEFGLKDEGCPDSEPNCFAEANETGTECFLCLNDNMTIGAQDQGCVNLETPNCDADDQAFGVDCFYCKDDQDFPSSVGISDTGCSPSTPTCEASASDPPYGLSCIFCRNDKPNDETDIGCSYDEPNCDADLNQTGVECFFCKNDTEAEGEIDTGCSEEAPNCNAQDGTFGSACFLCVNDQSFGSKDTGCTDVAPNCIADTGETGVTCSGQCTNDQDILGVQDSGCPPEKPNCQALFGKNGNTCYLCQNDEENLEKQDTGCPGQDNSETVESRCDAPLDKFGDVCFICKNDFRVRVPGDVKGDNA